MIDKLVKKDNRNESANCCRIGPNVKLCAGLDKKKRHLTNMVKRWRARQKRYGSTIKELWMQLQI